jgi:hypothetical protein
MKAISAILILLLVILFAIMMTGPAIAGPGGKIASAAFKTFWGRVFLLCLTILFLPLIVNNKIKLRMSEKRALKDLRFVSSFDSRFEWTTTRERVIDCFNRVHDAWQQENVEMLSDWIIGWYIKNQQMLFLDKWKKQGLKNHCEVGRFVRIRPILFIHRNDGAPHEGSKLVVAITAKLKDYLINRDTDQIVVGYPDFQNVRTVWSFTFSKGDWKVSNIDESQSVHDYVDIRSELPNIEQTISNNHLQNSK